MRKGASAYPRIVNNFLHDMATGTWAACVLVLWRLSAERSGVPAEAAEALLSAAGDVFVLLAVALAVIAVTGGVRLRYWRSQSSPDELAEKRKALIAKHVAFLGIYGLGTWWAWTLAR